MSRYSLYGTKLIKDDSTLESFTKGVIELVDTNDIEDLEKRYNKEFGDTEFEDVFMDRVEEILEHDISRTDIDYPVLMEK